MPAPPTSPYHLPPEPQDWWQAEWPQVSVSVVTYNQRNLIGRALDSILMQEVDFAYEIVVGDDASNDGSREILIDYQRRFPDIIRLLLYDQKLPGTPGRLNNMRNPMACRGRYTAWLDGDDYWLDANKLQDQYDVMEKYSALSCCFHDTRCEEVDEGGALIDEPFLRSEPASSRRSTGFYPHEAFCANRNIKVHTSSFFFRTRIFGEWPDDYEQVVSADQYLYLLVTQRGPAYYEDRVRSVNERQVQSLTNTKHYLSDERLMQQIEDTDLYRRRFPATTLTDSYSAFAVRLAKEVTINSLQKANIQRIAKMIVRIVQEPRGFFAGVKNRLNKLFLRWR